MSSGRDPGGQEHPRGRREPRGEGESAPHHPNDATWGGTLGQRGATPGHPGDTLGAPWGGRGPFKEFVWRRGSAGGMRRRQPGTARVPRGGPQSTARPARGRPPRVSINSAHGGPVSRASAHGKGSHPEIPRTDPHGVSRCFCCGAPVAKIRVSRDSAHGGPVSRGSAHGKGSHPETPRLHPHGVSRCFCCGALVAKSREQQNLLY